MLTLNDLKLVIDNYAEEHGTRKICSIAIYEMQNCYQVSIHFDEDESATAYQIDKKP